MKNIELREDHKAKLLEMCVKLFPEDEFTFDNDLGEDGFIDRNFLGKTKSNLMWNDEGSHFHWFEFCLTELYDRMYQIENDTFGVSDAHEDLVIEELGKIVYNMFETHPVDYLYEEFKKLKL